MECSLSKNEPLVEGLWKSYQSHPARYYHWSYLSSLKTGDITVIEETVNRGAGDGPALFTVDGNNSFDIVYVLETLVQKLVGLQRITIFVVRIEVVATSQENDTSARFEDLQMYRERTVFFMPVIGIVAESVHIFI